MPELDDLGLGEEENCMNVRSFFIFWYFVGVAESSFALASVSCDSVRPLLVAALTIRSRWPSRAWSARSLAGEGMFPTLHGMRARWAR